MRGGERLPDSFRDPAGFLFWDGEGRLLRQVNTRFAEEFEHFRRSGLMAHLADKRWLIAHTEVSVESALSPDAYAVLAPERVRIVSCPSEWPFSQLRAAALRTLELADVALSYGMLLRDARADNIQEIAGTPTLIDLLSFSRYRPGQPWVAYRQFCEQFLCPLVLMSEFGPDLGRLHGALGDGVPLEATAGLLGWRSWLPISRALHIGWHARMARSSIEARRLDKPRGALSQPALRRLLGHLHGTIESLRLPIAPSRWSEYQRTTSYTARAAEEKQKGVLSLAAAIDARVVLDVAGNDGHFSRELLRAGAACTVSTDQDALTSELAYIAARAQGAHALHALVCDAELLLRGACSAGSPRPLAQRVGADTAMLLAASHHLAITSGMPYALQARQLASLAPRLIVEYVPPYDRQAVAMLAQRPEPPHPMDRASFIEGFSDAFSLRVQLPIEESDRELFLFERR